MVAWIEAEREVRSGLQTGPRVRPRLDRWRLAEAAVSEARAHGPVVLLTCGVEPGPPVLITMDRGEGERGPEVRVCASYVQAVIAAGGRPLLVPPGEPRVERLLDLGRALVITGGSFDIHPRFYGESVTARLDRVEDARTEMELGLIRRAMDRDLPLLGVCGGMQAMAVAAGGRLIQDLPSSPSHEQPTDPAQAWHPVRLTGRLAEWLGPEVPANSTHHQAVAEPGDGFLVEGRTPDGVIEAMRHSRHPFAVGVQWHPERMGDLRLYQRLLDA